VLSVRHCVPWPLKTRGIALHLLDLGGDISGNGLSKLSLTIAAAFAEAERHRIRERIGQVKADQKARGRNLGGKVPFGYPRASPRVSQFEFPQLHQEVRASEGGFLIMMALVGTFAFEFEVSLPLLAHDTFEGGADACSRLLSGFGGGAMIGVTRRGTCALFV
jgi:hypothetical protein